MSNMIIGNPHPTIPWEGKPSDYDFPIWRYGKNHIIDWNPIPCAALCDTVTGRIAPYCGAADTYTAVAFCQVDGLIDYMKTNSEV